MLVPPTSRASAHARLRHRRTGRGPRLSRRHAGQGPGSADSGSGPPEQHHPNRRRATVRRPIVREVRTDGDNTLALVISGSALLIAAGAVAISGYDHRRIGQIAHH